MNGLETREQRKAHVKALAEELDDLQRSLKQAKERRATIPEDKIIRCATADQRISHLNERIAATKEQLTSFAGGARSPRQDAETRTGGQAAAKPAPKSAPGK